MKDVFIFEGDYLECLTPVFCRYHVSMVQYIEWSPLGTLFYVGAGKGGLIEEKPGAVKQKLNNPHLVHLNRWCVANMHFVDHVLPRKTGTTKRIIVMACEARLTCTKWFFKKFREKYAIFRKYHYTKLIQRKKR